MASGSFNPPGPFTLRPGESLDVEVAWVLNPGTPDRLGKLSLVWGDQQNNVEATVIVDGPDAEPTPELILSGQATGGKALVTSDVANIEILDATHIRLTPKA